MADVGDAIPKSVGRTASAGTSALASREDHDHALDPNIALQQIQIEHDGVGLIGTRRRINFKAGANVTLTITDDPASDRVTVQIAAVGGGGGGGDASGTRASRPAASTAGNFYYATDVKVRYYDTGTAWQVASAAVPRLGIFIPGTIPHSVTKIADAYDVAQDVAYLDTAFVQFDAAPVGGTASITFKKNGTAIATVTVSAGSTTGSASVTAGQESWAQGDVLTIDTGAGTATTLPKDMIVQLRVG